MAKRVDARKIAVMYRRKKPRSKLEKPIHVRLEEIEKAIEEIKTIIKNISKETLKR